MLSLINDEFGTDYDAADAWEEILTPEDLLARGVVDDEEAPAVSSSLVGGPDLPSEDEEDSDYGYGDRAVLVVCLVTSLALHATPLPVTQRLGVVSERGERLHQQPQHGVPGQARGGRREQRIVVGFGRDRPG